MTQSVSETESFVRLTVEVVVAHVSNNAVTVGDTPALIETVHAALARLGSPAQPERVADVPAVSVRASVKPDYLVCLEDGKKLKMLKRHLMTRYGMTPDDYLRSGISQRIIRWLLPIMRLNAGKWPKRSD